MSNINDMAEQLNFKALDYVKIGKLRLAKKLFRKSIELDPTNGSYYNNLGSVFEEQNQTMKAIPYYQMAAYYCPNVGMFWQNLGSSYSKIGDRENALWVYDEGLKNDPNEPGLWFNKGCWHIENKEFIEAKMYFEKVLKISPEDKDAKLNLNYCINQIKKMGNNGY